jgi:hypothetical protein
MASEYARIIRSIWGDPDWRNLDGESQRLYLLMVSQPTISNAGVLPFQIRRWAQTAADGTLRKTKLAFGQLELRRYTVTDPETEETLVRSYVRHDGALSIPNVTKAFCTAVRAIQSADLRDVVISETARLVDSYGSDSVPPKGLPTLMRPMSLGGLAECISPRLAKPLRAVS